MDIMGMLQMFAFSKIELFYHKKQADSYLKVLIKLISILFTKQH